MDKKWSCTIQCLREVCVVVHKSFQRLVLIITVLLIRGNVCSVLLRQLCFVVQELTPALMKRIIKKNHFLFCRYFHRAVRHFVVQLPY